MADIGKLSMIITANAGPFAQGLGQAQNSLAAFGQSGIATFRQLDAQGLALSKLGNLLGVNLTGGIIAGIESAWGKVNDTLARLNGEIKAAARLGLDPEFFQGLLHGLHLDAGEIERPLVHFQNSLVQAQLGSREARSAFEALGISFQDLSRMNTEQALLRISDGLAGLRTGADRTYIGFQLFGRGGQELMTRLASGTASVNAEMERARREGHVLSESERRDVAEAMKAWKLLGSEIEGLWTRVAVSMAPTVRLLGQIVSQAAQLVGWLAQLPGAVSIMGAPIATSPTGQSAPAGLQAALGVGEILTAPFTLVPRALASLGQSIFGGRGSENRSIAGGAMAGALGGLGLGTGEGGTAALAAAALGGLNQQIAATSVQAIEARNELQRMLKTPVEIFREEFERLSALQSGGAISRDLQAGGVLRALDQLDRGGDRGPQFAGAAQFGSADAASAIIRNQFGESSRESQQDRVRRVLEQQRDQDRDRNQRLIEIRELIAGGAMGELVQLAPG